MNHFTDVILILKQYCFCHAEETCVDACDAQRRRRRRRHYCPDHGKSLENHHLTYITCFFYCIVLELSATKCS